MKIYVVAGNIHQFLHYRADKFNSLKDTADAMNVNDFVNVSSHNVLKGVQDPHGVFIGTWRDRLDITEVLNTLSICSRTRNPALDNLRSEIIPPIKPTPKISGKTAIQVYIDEAADLMAKEIDRQIIEYLSGDTK